MPNKLVKWTLRALECATVHVITSQHPTFTRALANFQYQYANLQRIASDDPKPKCYNMTEYEYEQIN